LEDNDTDTFNHAALDVCRRSNLTKSTGREKIPRFGLGYGLLTENSILLSFIQTRDEIIARHRDQLQEFQQFSSEVVSIFDDQQIWSHATHGEKDALVLTEMAEYHKARISHAQVSYYPGVEHTPFWGNPERFNAEMRSFVTSM
jgi:pimeloyl-ACP methyl ester carboxylesterase